MLNTRVAAFELGTPLVTLFRPERGRFLMA
jgi:hypothetical protein